MIKLMKYLKKSAGYIVLIIGLLFLQAYCDLSLPDYTSKIINVGIQQGGIPDGVPEKMRKSTMEDLQIFIIRRGQCERLVFIRVECVLCIFEIDKNVVRTYVGIDCDLEFTVFVCLDSCCIVCSAHSDLVEDFNILKCITSGIFYRVICIRVFFCIYRIPLRTP